jgi:hypothetical protein
VIILDLYFLELGLQIGFRGLNLQVIAGVALMDGGDFQFRQITDLETDFS